jgi:hypothetical protein
MNLSQYVALIVGDAYLDGVVVLDVVGLTIRVWTTEILAGGECRSAMRVLRS